MHSSTAVGSRTRIKDLRLLCAGSAAELLFLVAETCCVVKKSCQGVGVGGLSLILLIRWETGDSTTVVWDGAACQFVSERNQAKAGNVIPEPELLSRDDNEKWREVATDYPIWIRVFLRRSAHAS